MPLNIISVSCHDLCNGLPEFKQMLIGDRALDAVFDNSKIKDAVPQLNFSVSLVKDLIKLLNTGQNLLHCMTISLRAV